MNTVCDEILLDDNQRVSYTELFLMMALRQVTWHYVESTLMLFTQNNSRSKGVGLGVQCTSDIDKLDRLHIRQRISS